MKRRKQTTFVCDACQYDTPSYEEMKTHRATLHHKIQILRKSINEQLSAFELDFYLASPCEAT